MAIISGLVAIGTLTSQIVMSRRTADATDRGEDREDWDATVRNQREYIGWVNGQLGHLRTQVDDLSQRLATAIARAEAAEEESRRALAELAAARHRIAELEGPQP